ncbi:hypothetical protein MKEN_00560900 [Mycena kentingensis (nom. inval.)]|nr:hypothetical protein MKEN_00560900 [Mycena kentingensis (nom. inval.)]
MRMVLDPDVHHPPPPRSPPPVAGTIRARPDHPTNSSDSEGSPTEERLSPGSRRALQRRRQGSPPSAAPPNPAPPTSQHSSAQPGIPAHPDAHQEPAPAPSTSLDADRAPLMAALESILTRAVATLNALNLPGEPSPAYSAPVLRLLHTLSERVPASTTTLSYADVAATSARAKLSHMTPSVPARTGNRVPAPTLDTAAAKPRRKTSTRRSAQRVIVRWTGNKPDPTKHDPYDIVNRIRCNTTIPSRVAGVMWLPSGDLALYVQAPGTAHQLLQMSDVLIGVLSLLRDLDGDPLIELDTAWTNVVVRNVPARDFFDDPPGFYEELDGQGVTVESVVRATPMVKGDGPGERRTVSVKVAFRDQTVARGVLKRRGIFVWGAHCPVVCYRG